MTNETNPSDAASPTDSANPSSTAPTEATMGNASDPVPAPGAPTDSANPEPTKPKKERKQRANPLLYDPTSIKGEAAEELRKAALNSHPLLVAQAKSVRDGVAKLQAATGPIAEAIGEVAKAGDAYAPFEAGIEKALRLPAALLVRVLPGGRELYARAKGRDAWTRATGLMAQLPESRLGLTSNEVAPLERAIQLATPTRKALDAAKQKKVPAAKAYMAAKRELDQALKVLRALLEVHRLSNGAMVSGASAEASAAPLAKHAKKQNVVTSAHNGNGIHR